MKQRIKDADIKNGDANEVVTSIVKDLSSARYDKYHFAFLDPFNPKSLKFETVKQMARLKRLDIMINFPIGPIRRNYNQWQKTDGAILDDFLGTSDWRKRVLNAHETVFCNTLVEIYFEQLTKIGFPEEGLGLIGENGEIYHGPKLASVKNSKNVPLYYLMLVSKHKLAAEIWKSILKVQPDGRRSLFS